MSKDVKFLLSTIIVAVVLALSGAVAGVLCTLAAHDTQSWKEGYNAGYEDGLSRRGEEYLNGLHDGQNAADQTLYATCEDPEIASQYPAGFCEGVSAYLGI